MANHQTSKTRITDVYQDSDYSHALVQRSRWNDHRSASEIFSVRLKWFDERTFLEFRMRDFQPRWPAVFASFARFDQYGPYVLLCLDEVNEFETRYTESISLACLAGAMSIEEKKRFAHILRSASSELRYGASDAEPGIYDRAVQALEATVDLISL